MIVIVGHDTLWGYSIHTHTQTQPQSQSKPVRGVLVLVLCVLFAVVSVMTVNMKQNPLTGKKRATDD